MATNDLCCDDIIGGEIYIQAVFMNGGGQAVYEGIGDVRIQPSRLERTAGSTSAGRIWVTEAPRPIRMLMSYANRCTANPMKLFVERCRINVTIVEKSRGFYHQINDGLSVGSPEINLSTGEISGIELVSDQYTVFEGPKTEASVLDNPILFPNRASAARVA